MNFLTDFGDQAVVLPLSAAIFCVLLLIRWWRGAGAWALSVVLVLGTILLLKIILAACAQRFGLGGLQSPSGHTSASALVYGGLVGLLLGARGPAPFALAAFVFAVAIGESRLALEAHTPADVVVGAAIGIAGAALLGRLAGPPPPRLKPLYVAGVALVVALLFHGIRLGAEQAIRAFAFADWLPFLAACHA